MVRSTTSAPSKRFARAKSTLPDPAGFQVAQPDPVEGLSLTGLDELVLENSTGLAVRMTLRPGENH